MRKCGIVKLLTGCVDTELPEASLRTFPKERRDGDFYAEQTNDYFYSANIQPGWIRVKKQRMLENIFL